MPLIQCRDCGRDVSDAAPQCIHCGRPTGAVMSSYAPPRALSPQELRYRCPHCSSTTVTKASLLHEQGVSHKAGRTIGVGLTNRGTIGVSTTSERALNQSNLARRLRPPVLQSTKRYVLTLITLGITVSMSSGKPSVGVLITFALAGVLHMSLARKYGEEYRREYAEWDELYMCNRCGETFALSAT